MRAQLSTIYKIVKDIDPLSFSLVTGCQNMDVPPKDRLLSEEEVDSKKRDSETKW